MAIPITTTNQGTATDADYSGVPLEVTFESGDTEVTFTFTATDDPVDDDGEWVKVTFGALSAGVSEGTTTEATVSITDNDVSGVTVSETALTVPEGGTAGETYMLVLDSQPTADVDGDGGRTRGHGGDPEPYHPDFHRRRTGNDRPDGDG